MRIVTMMIALAMRAFEVLWAWLLGVVDLVAAFEVVVDDEVGDEVEVDAVLAEDVGGVGGVNEDVLA